MGSLRAIIASYSFLLVWRDFYVASPGFADAVLLQVGHRAGACLSVGGCSQVVSTHVGGRVEANRHKAKIYVPAFLAGVANVCPAMRAVTIQAMVGNCIVIKDCLIVSG